MLYIPFLKSLAFMPEAQFLNLFIDHEETKSFFTSIVIVKKVHKTEEFSCQKVLVKYCYHCCQLDNSFKYQLKGGQE